jgi:recombination protein RecA
MGELLDLGIEHKLVEKSGAWMSYGDLRLGQGRENAKQFLHDNPEIMVEISERIRSEVGLNDVVDEMTEADDEPIVLED